MKLTIHPDETTTREGSRRRMYWISEASGGKLWWRDRNRDAEARLRLTAKTSSAGGVATRNFGGVKSEILSFPVWTRKVNFLTTKLCTFSPPIPVSDEASEGILTEKTFTSSTMVDGGWVWASSLSSISVLFVSVERRRENIISHYILSGSYFLLRVISFSLSGCLIIMAYPDYVYSNSSRGIVRQASRKTLFLSFRGTKTHFKFIKLLPFICFCVSLLPVPLLLARSVGSLPHGSSQEPTKTRRKTRVKRRNVFSTFHLIKLDQIEKSHLMGGGGGDREDRKRETAKFSSNKTKIY